MSPLTGDSLLLVDAVRSLLESRDPGKIEIIGRTGSGKTTALGHLAAALRLANEVLLIDEPRPEQVEALSGDRWVVYATRIADSSVADFVFQLSSWTDDELIEYLMAAHSEACPSVINRIHEAPDRDLPQGNPEIWCLALEQFVADQSIRDVRSALRASAWACLQRPREAQAVRTYALSRILDSTKLAPSLPGEVVNSIRDHPFFSGLRHRAVQVLLAADLAADLLRAGADCEFLKETLPRDLIREIASVVGEDKKILDRLRRFVDGRDERFHAMAASLLHAAGTGWKPDRSNSVRLENAHLRNAQWSSVDLHKTVLRRADLTGADLTRARLDGAQAQEIRLRRARLRDASLVKVDFWRADLRLADLSSSFGCQAVLRQADLQSARFVSANLEEADFYQANLRGAEFQHAILSRAILSEATIDDADFSEADLTGALLARLPLRKGLFLKTRFVQADLSHCDLEGMELPDADFSQANLQNAYLTGSVLPRASFRYAKLINTGLAEVHWEGADLQSADLSGASFHLGSSRSGLVSSPYASEGSKTGFYTDDYDEQDFKAPEEIRKANLCGADLRGARVQDVDFYLVDLRRAVYTKAQEEHFRRCGAILVDRS